MTRVYAKRFHAVPPMMMQTLLMRDAAFKDASQQQPEQRLISGRDAAIFHGSSNGADAAS